MILASAPGVSINIAARDTGMRWISTDSLPQQKLTLDAADFRNENMLHPGERIIDKVRNNLFVLVHTSKSECFVGEPLIVTYKLYSRLNAKSFIAKQPSLAGFNKKDLVQVASLIGSIERIGGRPFEVRVLRKIQLIPLITGRLEIDPMELQHSIQFTERDSAAAGNQLTEFLHNKVREEQDVSKSTKISTRSSPIWITVLDVPGKDKPPSYGGAVGYFTMTTSLSSTSKRVGESAVLRLDIKGSGSLVLADVPTITLPKEIELLQAKSIPGSKKPDPTLNVSRSFEYLIVFREAGLVEIPPISFSYFDPIKKMYKTIHSMSISTPVLENPAIASTSRKATKVKAKPPGRSKNFLPLFLMAIAASMIFLWNRFGKFGVRRRIRNVDQSADIYFTRAAERLKVVQDTGQGETTIYYYELNKVLWAVITERISLLPTELSKGNIFRELSRRGWTPEEVWELELTMNEYERNLYVPGYKDESDFQTAYQKAVNIISKLEQLPPPPVLSIQNTN